jgi:hypothetical protein
MNLGLWEILTLAVGLMIFGYIFINGIIYTYKMMKNRN